jgi:hypothetical protein
VAMQIYLMNKIVLYLNMFLIILNVQKDSLLYNGITGIELGHAMWILVF